MGGCPGSPDLSAPLASTDTAFDGIDPVDASVTNLDDETAGITVVPASGLVTSEAGGSAQFGVVLNARPSADVLIG